MKEKTHISSVSGFHEVSRDVERIEVDGGFDEVTTVTASDGMGTIKTYKNTVTIRNNK